MPMSCIFQQPNLYSNIMQHKTQSKAKLPPYSSLKEFESVQEPSKKLTKQANGKSSKKLKQQKSVNQSTSKGKPSCRAAKNNQNYNSINLMSNDPPRLKIAPHQQDNSKKQNRQEDKLRRNSSEKLMKTKSVSRIQLKSERRPVSPSPLCTRDALNHVQEKQNPIKNAASRTERQKKTTKKPKSQHPQLKKSASKPVLPQKPDQTQRSIRNRVSIKTEMSSKTHSVIKEEPKQKGSNKFKSKKPTSKEIKSQRNKPYKMPKPGKAKLEEIVQRSILYSEVSFQQYNNGDHPCESAYITNDKYFLPYPQLKAVKTEGCQIDNRSHSSMSVNKPQIIRAAIKIQKVFRGYITRKYIDQAKYIISKVKIIQAWWRRIMQNKKEKVNHKIPSASNSLITIKDFNDTIKTDKQKMFSESKENTLSNNKLNLRQFMKNILQQNQSQKHSNSPSSIKDEDSVNMSKDKSMSRDSYIQLKIKDEISSENHFFHSPKNLNSPSSVRTPTGAMFNNMKDCFANNGSMKEIMYSPRRGVVPGTSPQQLKNTPQKEEIPEPPCKEKTAPVVKVEQPIEAFETNFASIQEFCLLLVNYFRDKTHEMNEFISKLQALKEFRTNLILKTWNSHNLYSEDSFDMDETLPADYELLQTFQRPILFDKQMRQDIIRFPQIEIELLGKRFNLQSKVSGPAHRAFLEFIFDALQEAFYEQHRTTILAYGKSLNRHIFQNQQSLFENYFSSALGELYRWGQILCGLLADLPMEQQFLKQQRFKQFMKRIEPWDLGLSQSVAIKIEASQKIVLQLLSQMEMEIRRLI